MTSKELIRVILNRLSRVKILILIGGIALAILMFMIAKNSPSTFSVKSTLYPLTASPSGGPASSALTELIGGGGSTKTLSEEANVNIEEVARSRKTREAVVSQRLAIFGNKTMAEVLINDYNNNKSYFSQSISIPTTQPELVSIGASLLASNYLVKVNKNSLLEITFSSTNEKLITPASLILIDKISQFYKELKIKKAQFDYDFTQIKVDSLEGVLKKFDNQRIYLSNTTLFVPQGKLQYNVPKENLENNKILVLSQRNSAASNREEALWRKQKVTPIIEILDSPQPPFGVDQPSKVVYGTVGFILGCLFFALFSISGILYRYLNLEIKRKLADTVIISPISTTA